MFSLGVFLYYKPRVAATKRPSNPGLTMGKGPVEDLFAFDIHWWEDPLFFFKKV